MTQLALTNGLLATPFLDSNGKISQPWVKYLQNATQQINAPLGSDVETLQANLPANLTANAAGYLAYVTDYAHLLLWNGAGWQWGPGENGSGYVANFLEGAGPGVGWHACDGSQQNVLQSDGTLKLVTLPLMGAGGSFGQLTAYFRL